MNSSICHRTAFSNHHVKRGRKDFINVDNHLLSLPLPLTKLPLKNSNPQTPHINALLPTASMLLPHALSALTHAKNNLFNLAHMLIFTDITSQLLISKEFRTIEPPTNTIADAVPGTPERVDNPADHYKKRRIPEPMTTKKLIM